MNPGGSSFPLPLISPSSLILPRSNDVDPLLSRLLEKSVRRSSALDTESLCLRAGRSVWAIRADVHVLSCDGALIDACCAATVAALKHFQLPATSVQSGAEGDGVTVYAADRRAPIPLGVRHAPYAVTAAFLRAKDEKGGDERLPEGKLLALADPTGQELACAEAEVVVTANHDGEVCQVAKLGGVPADAVALLDVVEMGVRHVKEIAAAVDLALKRDEEGRKGSEVEASAENER
jgi:exosome complex component RRP45